MNMNLVVRINEYIPLQQIYTLIRALKAHTKANIIY